jgi:hypothetical protein
MGVPARIDPFHVNAGEKVIRFSRSRPRGGVMTNRLQWDVLVSAPMVTSDLLPGASEMKWSPISSTLISGKRDAVLVDTAITVDQNQKLVGSRLESYKKCSW